MPSRFWELGFGMILCLTIGDWRPRLTALPAGWCPWPLPAASWDLPSLSPFPRTAWFPFPMALLPVGCATGLIAIVCARPRRVEHTRTVATCDRPCRQVVLFALPLALAGLRPVPLDSRAGRPAACRGGGRSDLRERGRLPTFSSNSRPGRAQKVRPLSRRANPGERDWLSASLDPC
jgi:hypothetical protein